MAMLSSALAKFSNFFGHSDISESSDYFGKECGWKSGIGTHFVMVSEDVGAPLLVKSNLPRRFRLLNGQPVPVSQIHSGWSFPQARLHRIHDPDYRMAFCSCSYSLVRIVANHRD